jgi:predicted amidohydrolase YtcJ
VSAPSPLTAIATAVERRTVLGTNLGPPDLAASVESALRAYTIDSAFACHADQSVGSLEEGKWADFAILSADPTAVDVSQIAAIKVEQTWSAGAQVA